MNASPAVLGVIPARLGSGRFPSKVIAPIHGKPMVQHVWEAASKSRGLTHVLVATDDPGIASVVQGFGGTAVLTGPYSCGTDRVASVAADRTEDFIVNLQGDEPMIDPDDIDRLISALQSRPDCAMVTLAVKRTDAAGLADPNVVKVVCAENGDALYFSRHPVACGPDGVYWKHIGIYAFRREALMTYSSLAPTVLESTERLEQLRALGHGMKIHVVPIARDTVGVDVPEDIERVERVWKPSA